MMSSLKAVICGLVLAICLGSASASPLITNDNGRAVHFVENLVEEPGAIVAEALHFLGSGNVTGTRGPWCADFVSFTLKRTGHRPLASRLAESALSYGSHTMTPQSGDLVVMRHHVGFFVGWNHGKIIMVSGNWSHRVSRSLVSLRSVLAFVRV